MQVSPVVKEMLLDVLAEVCDPLIATVFICVFFTGFTFVAGISEALLHFPYH